jgi:predicted AAA+ superfamily ATPase
MAKERYLFDTVEEFVRKKMVFIGGPRQVGKTTLAIQFLDPPRQDNPAYMNWDDFSARAKLKAGELPFSPLVVLDEIHKHRKWRGLIKGFYDTKGQKQKFIVTGSARLDHYRFGGDSLLGRYRYLRLHPFSVAELGIKSKSDLSTLLKFGGFPEPFFAANERDWKLWAKERIYRLVQDDIRGLENLKEYSSIELLADALPDRVGSPLSVRSVSEDLEVSPKTVESWIGILERVYFCFRIMPYGAPKIRAVKKEKKLYLWDWSMVTNEGARFENLVASHLLKFCHFREDTEGEKMELRFIRDTDKREIDFVVLRDKKPLFAVECKTGEKQLSSHINYFRERTGIKLFYQVHMGSKDYEPGPGIRVLPFTRFSEEIGLV